MGIFSDILKAIPRIAALQRDVGILAAEIKSLRESLREAQDEIKKLKERASHLPRGGSLEQADIEILVYLSNNRHYTYPAFIANQLDLSKTRVELHLLKMLEDGYVQTARLRLDRPMTYHLTEKSKSFLIENNL